MRHAMRKLFVIGLVVSGIALPACAEPDDVQLTSIEDILSGRVPDGEPVTIEGTVTATGSLPAVGRVSYEVTADGQTVPVVTDGDAPALAEELRIAGIVRTAFTVEDVNLGTVLEETSRDAAGSPATGIPWWVWAAVGGGALLITLAVLLLVRRKRPGAETLPCPHCGAPTEADWVVCTECGRRLDAAPTASETMISTPAGPPPPSPEEVTERRRRSASTVLLPPGEDDEFS